MNMVRDRSGYEIRLELENPSLIIRVGDADLDITDEISSPIIAYGFVKPHAYAKWLEIVGNGEKVDGKITELSVDVYERFHKTRKLFPSDPCRRLNLIYQKEDLMDRARAEEHYAEHRNKRFFPELIGMITEGPTRQFVFVGTDAINVLSEVAGPTDPKKAPNTTIRGIYGDKSRSIMYNAVHRADGTESLVRELMLHFTKEEMGESLWQRIEAYKAYLDQFKTGRPAIRK